LPELNHLLPYQKNCISLSRRDEKFEVLLEASEDLIFMLDSKGCFKRVNESGAALLDYSSHELLGRHILEIVDSKSNRAIASSFQEILNSNEITTFEAIFVSKSRKEMVFEITAKTIFDKSVKPELLAVAKDITRLRHEAERANDLAVKLIEAQRLIAIERQRTNRRNTILDELARLKDEFISNVSHELRTPLASIIGYSEAILSDPNMSKEVQTEFTEIILRESKRLANLVNNVLDITKIEGGGIQLDRSNFNIIEILNNIIEKIKPLINKHGLSMSCDIPVDEIIINGDEKKLSQVFEGLLNNAIKFTDSGGRIFVSARSLYKEIEIIISDTGVGIPENDIPNIFQKFYRVSRPGKEIPGTGLGLVFVKQIVDLHKGLITVNSEVNMGTSFVIKLPKENKLQQTNKGLK
jgi:PAS domain S-box-containing protein